MQKLFYLPEAHTDFLFAVLAEELGLAGVLLTLALFMALIWRSFYIARLASEAGLKFGAYLAAGFGLWLGIQAFINIGVNMGVLPTKGLTLPLMSYGRSSLIVALAWVGLLLRVYHEASSKARGSASVRGVAAMSAPDPHHGGWHRRARVPRPGARAAAARAIAAVVWLGTARGLEARVIPAEGIPIEWLSVGGLRGKGMMTWLAAPFRLTLALAQALSVMRRHRPMVVVGLGGFVTGPGGLAAWLTRRPLVIHEQNAIAGFTNRMPGAPGARGAGSLSRQLRPRHARARHRQSRAPRYQRAAAAGCTLRRPHRTRCASW